jgi:hypothetical protein
MSGRGSQYLAGSYATKYCSKHLVYHGAWGAVQFLGGAEADADKSDMI